MSGRSHSAIGSRAYRPAPDDCARALEMLLRNSVSTKAGEPTPEPDGRDDYERLANKERRPA